MTKRFFPIPIPNPNPNPSPTPTTHHNQSTPITIPKMPGIPRPIARIKVTNPRTREPTTKEFHVDDPVGDNILSRTDFTITKAHPDYEWLLRLTYVHHMYWGAEFSRLVWDRHAGEEVWRKVVFLVAKDEGLDGWLRFTHVMFGRDSWELDEDER